MAVFSLSDHKDRKEANSKLPSKEFIKKYKWWLVAGLAVGLIAFMYFRNKSGSSGSATTSATGAASGAVDPNTGVPYATELAQAQNASTVGSGASGGGSGDGSSGGSSGGTSTVTGTPSTSPAATPATAPAAPATAPATPPATTPGTPAPHKQPTRVKRPPKPVPRPVKPVTVIPARTLPAIRRVGYPYPTAAKGTVNA